MKKAILITTILLLTFVNAIQISAVRLSNESLNYKVIYKWGLVHKQAGTARIVLNKTGKGYSAAAYARSDPWADRFYKLRDTMMTVMRQDFSPTHYEFIGHEDGKYSHDIVKFTHHGQTVNGNCTRIRQGRREPSPTVKHTSLTAQGMTVDMLSSFYYLRTLDFTNMKPGTKKSINIFSGKRKELLTFTYSGMDNVKINGKNHSAYKVTFTFTSDGRKESSDPIQAWVSTDEQRIPLKLIGKLKIGQVQCIYVP